MTKPTDGFLPMPARLAGEHAERLRRAQNALAYNVSFLDDALRAILPHDLVVIAAPTGLGKCLDPDTLVMLHTGALVRARGVVVGDRLMGPDGQPRTVTSTTIGRGPMFEIAPTKGEPWRCNDVHVLTLVSTETNVVVDIPLDKYLLKSKWFRDTHKLFSVGVDFPPTGAELEVPPYFLGLWLGDGAKGVGPNGLLRVCVTTMDAEVLAECEAIASRFGLQVKPDISDGKCPSYRIVNERGAGNPLLVAMRFALGHGLVVPPKYLRASREDRLQLLAGWMDSDGSFYEGCFDFVQKRADWADGVAFVARSLGLKVTRSTKTIDGETYQRMTISGDVGMIPTRIPRKQAGPRLQRKNALRTGFEVRELGVGPYVGFTLDGDGRFLLGDFTVTHNTDLALSIASANARAGQPTHYFALEAEPNELEQRVKYQEIARYMKSNKLPHADDLNYVDWFLGRCDDFIGDLNAWADQRILGALGNLHTFYRGAKFDATDLAKWIVEIHQQTTLIVVDHLHYVDNDEDENEHRALGDTVKIIRDVSLRVGRPIILVVHLRKRDQRTRKVMPDLDDIHGTSNIVKIATQVITLERATDIEAPKWYLSPTFMAVLKDRRAGAPRVVAMSHFNIITKTYTPEYTLGRAHGAKWEPMGPGDAPSWAKRHRPMVADEPSRQAPLDHPNRPGVE